MINLIISVYLLLILLFLELFFVNQKFCLKCKFKIFLKYKTIIDFLLPNANTLIYNNLFKSLLKSLFENLFNNIKNKKTKLDNTLIIPINIKKNTKNV